MKCEVCKHKREHYEDYSFCSEYCNTTTPEQQAEWKAAKSGDYCVYPCSQCGCAIEDELSRERVCSGCTEVWRLKNLLRRCRRYVPEALKKAIGEATKRR